MSNKITLKEFFDSEEMLAIHCHTEEKANKLLKEFDKLGEVWRDGDKYIEINHYDTYYNSTCYDNQGDFCSLDYYLNHNYKIYEFDDIIFEEQPKNLIPLIAKELGVEIGEEFKDSQNNLYRFQEKSLERFDIKEQRYKMRDDYLRLFINGHKSIIKLPQKPKLTEDEKAILRNLPKKYKYIARDNSGELFVYEDKPKKDGDGWTSYRFDFSNLFKHLFQFIKWEDEEAYNIEELLKGE